MIDDHDAAGTVLDAHKFYGTYIMVNITKKSITADVTQFYRLPQVKAHLNVSGSSIWAWVKAGKFPKPIKLSENTTAWNAADIEAWAQSRIDASKR